ncbi:diguanylate cyclase domain protein [Acetobacteraceae bacterium AT-5844]|nr:diguanylate cyclase domain protein [Acetobacteraceae bacterium AT-5844]
MLGRLRATICSLLGREPAPASDAIALAEGEKLYRLLADHATDLILRTDLDGTPTYVSPASRAILGYEPEELVGVSILNVIHPDDITAALARMRRLKETQADQRGRHRVVRADGQIAWVEARLHLAREPETGEPSEIVIVVRDVTEQVRNESHLEELAGIDYLTRLPIRRAFLSALEQWLARGAGCALLHVDLDDFKAINDSLGHMAGDAVLAEVAARLKREAPEEAMVARLGGDEFAILLTECQVATAPAVAERILTALAVPIRADTALVEVSASIGIAFSTEEGTETEALLRAADVALYNAKRLGAARYLVFSPDMEEERREAAIHHLRLRQAIAAEEIIPFYQPLVDLRSRRLIGLEVLARWRHPERGLLPPSEFIAATERAGLTGQLFEALLRQASQDAASWPEGLKIAVNMAPSQLQDSSVSDTILNILAQTGLSPLRLELEVTESGIVHDLSTAKQVLGLLRAAGIRVALDDFGTGYASLSMVKELAVDRLKIDRSFVAALALAPESGRYVSAIIGLARALGLGTTAEGIEDAATMRRIAAMGCDLGQGYYFGRPRPAEQLGPWLIAAAEGIPALPEAEMREASRAE